MSIEFIQAAATALFSPRLEIVKTTPVGGGCIHELFRIETKTGREFAVKIAKGQHANAMLSAELAGLSAIADTNSVRTPRVDGIWQSPDGNSAVMFLEWIEPGRRSIDFGERLATALANLHQSPSFDGRFGFSANNFIGSSEQFNSWSDSWVEFWRDRRLLPQLNMAKSRGAGRELLDAGHRVADRLDRWLDDDRPSSVLIHGDLWSGNVLADSKGDPVLIDPAVYYSSCETELGMTTLFGDFGESFLQEYLRLSPLADGWEDRVTIYRLYHLLNHFNLFGSSHESGCLEIVKRLAS